MRPEISECKNNRIIHLYHELTLNTYKTLMTKEYFTDDEGIKCCRQINDKGELHNTEGPALIKYYDNDQPKSEFYHFNGIFMNTDGPVFVSYYEDGTLKNRQWKNTKGYHRNGEPAFEYWHPNGQITRHEYAINGKPKMVNQQSENGMRTAL